MRLETAHHPCASVLVRVSVSSEKREILHAGVAGVFSEQQIALLKRCIPGGIKLQEPDGKVHSIVPPSLSHVSY